MSPAVLELSPKSQADPLKRVAGELALTNELVGQGGVREGAMEAVQISSLALLKALVGQEG